MEDTFRNEAVKHILNIRSKIGCFSRVCQFHGIAIVDAYTKCLRMGDSERIPANEDSFIYAMACLFLASKFNGKNEKIF